MFTRLVAAVAVAVTGGALVVTAAPAASAQGTTQSTVRAVAVHARPAGKLPTRAQLRAVRLKLADLPAGFAVAHGESSLGDEQSSAPECDRLFNAIGDRRDPRPARFAQSSFMRMDDLLVGVSNELAVYRSAAPINADLEVMRTLVRTCPKWTETGQDGATVTLRAHRLRIGHPGSDAFAVRVTATPDSPIPIRVRLDLAAVRVRNAVTYVEIVSLGSAGVSLRALTRLSVERLSPLV